MTRKQVKNTEHDIYYAKYINKLNPSTILKDGFEIGKENIINFYRDIPIEKQSYRYEAGKWSIKEVLQHIIDTERVFMYRCFRIAREDTTSLAGYDQDVYISPSGADRKSMDALIGEYIAVRDASISLLNSLSNDNLAFVGEANGGSMSARAAAFIILGHEIWHNEVIKERYL